MSDAKDTPQLIQQRFLQVASAHKNLFESMINVFGNNAQLGRDKVCDADRPAIHHALDEYLDALAAYTKSCNV
jgi:hypothetical protein